MLIFDGDALIEYSLITLLKITCNNLLIYLERKTWVLKIIIYIDNKFDYLKKKKKQNRI